MGDRENVKLLLSRIGTSNQGTLGTISSNVGFACCTLELPWRDNRINVSCIPEGDYSCIPVKSRKFGDVYWVNPVENRTGILIHSGNFAGDSSEGLRTHSYGCILLGRYFGTIKNQLAVFFSRSTIRSFMDHMDGMEATIEIRNLGGPK